VVSENPDSSQRRHLWRDEKMADKPEGETCRKEGQQPKSRPLTIALTFGSRESLSPTGTPNEFVASASELLEVGGSIAGKLDKFASAARRDGVLTAQVRRQPSR
jgi:hypothetical protein